MHNLDLKQSILDELEFDPKVDAAHVGVVVDDGVVTLTGHAGSYAEKLAVQQAVQRIFGVKAIVDEIEVRLSGTPQTADHEIAERAVEVLKWRANVPSEKIKVAVCKGHITLSGEAEWQFQRAAAENAVRTLSHITGVSNQIKLRPSAQVADIQKRIEDALKRSAETEARNIRVSVSEGTVTLEGHVDNWSERDAVSSAAWSVAGITNVNNRLTVI